MSVEEPFTAAPDDPALRATGWWMAHGWATRGSQLQTQLYVNRQAEALTEKVLQALPTLAERDPRLQWVVPLAKPLNPRVKPFAEPRDAAMLASPLASSVRAAVERGSTQSKAQPLRSWAKIATNVTTSHFCIQYRRQHIA